MAPFFRIIEKFARRDFRSREGRHPSLLSRFQYLCASESTGTATRIEGLLGAAADVTLFLLIVRTSRCRESLTGSAPFEPTRKSEPQPMISETRDHVWPSLENN